MTEKKRGKPRSKASQRMKDGKKPPQSPESPESPGPSEQEGTLAGSMPMVDPVDSTPIPNRLAILPIRGSVMFPGTVMPMGVGRPSSMRLVNHGLGDSKIVGLLAQVDADKEQPTPDELYGVGTAVMVLKVIRQADESLSLIVHGLQRFAVKQFVQTEPYLVADVELLTETMKSKKESPKFQAAVKNLRETALELIALSPGAPEQAQVVVMNIEGAGHLADFLASNLGLPIEEKQDLLEQLDVGKRVRAVQMAVTRQLEIARLQHKINEDVQSTISESQRKAYLREQMKAIQKELGITEDGTTAQIAELREKLDLADPPARVMEEAERELKRLESIPAASPEYSVILSYLETIVELPWNKASEDNLDLDRAQGILDRDHFDLEKVKRRLIEYLAVRKLNPDGRGAILCFLGPPGVGKTSLGESIASALGRTFARMSLGGIRDEAEIRGHRRTYIGSMPGRIIQELRRAGTRNPVMMLDEIDKLGSDFHGDPSSALLEVLDPRQNHAFVDRYLDVPFDLTHVLFIATANYMDPVPPALRDRMEVIEIPGYTPTEKLQIARQYLLPRQLKENGLKAGQVTVDVAALRQVISGYTREAGVRELERQIGAVCRSIAADVARNGRMRKKIRVDAGKLSDILGPEQYLPETAMQSSQPGVVTGLAYTPVGGQVLFIEATKFAGKGQIQLTGHIGDVMKESVYAALSLLKSRAEALGLDRERFADTDIHVHVPAGAIPKDGPSAGAAMFTALASLFMDRPVRGDLAMTGEITLRGLVLPIGGLKEKTLAALGAGIRTVVAPLHNKKDFPELTEEVRKKLEFIFVETVDEILEVAFAKRRSAGRSRQAGRRSR